jgi:uncharacterized protein (DUF58 family)
MQTGSPDYRKYLDPRVLSRIGGLELRARLIVEGFFSGIHHSPQRGLSVEFADHRQYTQGDDLRHIDWRVFGRTDKYYIKEYEQETNLNLMLVVDGSESMSYRSSEELMTKHEYATSIAAAVAYLTLQQQDAVGVARFDERLREFLRPQAVPHQWRTLVAELAGKVGPAKTSIRRVLAELAERLPHRVLIVLLSDLFDAPDDILKGLKLLRYRRHEVIVWNVWDPAELTLPFAGPTRFEGLEASGRLLVDPRALRARYVAEVERFQQQMRRGCGHMLIDYAMYHSAMPLDASLSAYLATRSARLRQRSSRVLGGG